MQWTSLKRLSISDNNIVMLPPALQALTTLAQLEADNNDIRFMEEGVGEWRDMQVFRVSHNYLRSLPHGFKGQSHLLEIDISNNDISVRLVCAHDVRVWTPSSRKRRRVANAY